MNTLHLNAFKIQTEKSLENLLIKTLRDSQHLPEIMHGMIVMTAAGEFCQGSKDNYLNLKTEFQSLNQDFDITKEEYEKIIDDITTKVLGEFIEIPKNTGDDYYTDDFNDIDDYLNHPF